MDKKKTPKKRIFVHLLLTIFLEYMQKEYVGYFSIDSETNLVHLKPGSTCESFMLKRTFFTVIKVHTSIVVNWYADPFKNRQYI